MALLLGGFGFPDINHITAGVGKVETGEDSESDYFPQRRKDAKFGIILIRAWEKTFSAISTLPAI
jgi:hypothetical protein